MIKPILIESKEYSDIQLGMNGILHLESGKSIALRKYQYIILIDTEEEIVEGDLVYCEHTDSILEFKNKTACILANKQEEVYGDKTYHKVISSTNKLPLEPYQGHFNGIDCTNYLPLLSSKSIRLLINYYNEHKCMPESVEVECENQKLDLVDGKEYLLDKTGWKINIPETKGIYIKSIKVTDHREEAGFHISAKVLIDPKEETIIGCSENCLYLDKPVKIPKLNQQGEIDITIPEKPLHRQIIDAVGGEEAFCKAAGINIPEVEETNDENLLYTFLHYLYHGTETRFYDSFESIVESFKNANFNYTKEKLYTEEEVKSLCRTLAFEAPDQQITALEDEEDWYWVVDDKAFDKWFNSKKK